MIHFCTDRSDLLLSKNGISLELKFNDIAEIACKETKWIDLSSYLWSSTLFLMHAAISLTAKISLLTIVTSCFYAFSWLGVCIKNVSCCLYVLIWWSVICILFKTRCPRTRMRCWITQMHTGVFHIPQNSSIAGALPSDCLVS